MTLRAPCQTEGPELPFEIFPLFPGTWEELSIGFSDSKSSLLESTKQTLKETSHCWRCQDCPPNSVSQLVIWRLRPRPKVPQSLSWRYFLWTMVLTHLRGENSNLVPRRVEDKGHNSPSLSLSLFCLWGPLHAPGPSLPLQSHKPQAHAQTPKELPSLTTSKPQPAPAQMHARTHINACMEKEPKGHPSRSFSNDSDLRRVSVWVFLIFVCWHTHLLCFLVIVLSCNAFLKLRINIHFTFYYLMPSF